MGLKKKKNIIVLSVCMVMCFILYQLYFFLTITAEVNNGVKVIYVLDNNNIKNVVHIKSEADKFINEHGVIKGVYYTNIKSYRPDSKLEFKCISSKQLISYDKVNDDFCDCEDGSDEPSTSACPTGVFYCDTQHKKHTVLSIPSSKVNDGICDCCDGSDEWLIGNKLLGQSTKQHHRHYVNKCLNECS